MIDKMYKRKVFNRAANSYEEFSGLQDQISQSLLEKLEYLNINPTNILDLGCGTGKNGLHFLNKFKKTSLVNFDLSENMLEQARKKLTTAPINYLNKSTNFHVCGDMENVPFRDNLFDLVWSSSAIQWSDNLPIVLKHIKRVLKPNGFFIFSTFGPETLKELRMINEVLYNHPKTNNFLDLKRISDFVILEGFENSSFDVKKYRLDYKSVEDILYDIKGVGATNGNKYRTKGLRGREFINIMKQHYEKYRVGELYPATYEVIYGVVSKKNNKN
tara:strand:- start:2001 stop:2819 length:819 start_codon:yes stop_codon:yes gene_type:complete